MKLREDSLNFISDSLMLRKTCNSEVTHRGCGIPPPLRVKRHLKVDYGVKNAWTGNSGVERLESDKLHEKKS